MTAVGVYRPEDAGRAAALKAPRLVATLAAHGADERSGICGVV
jgi:hypothetical protein